MTSSVSLLLSDLKAHYHAYLTGAPCAGETGFSRLFRHWFSFNPAQTDPVHQAFLDKTSQLVQALAQALGELSAEQAPERQSAAAEAVGMMLSFQQKGQRTDRDWYLLAAGYACAPLLSLLSQEDLEAQRSALLEHTPRRLMLPKQLELLQEMECLLELRRE